METKKLVEMVENAKDFGEVWDFLDTWYESGKKKARYTVEAIKVKDGWLCKVIKVEEKLVGKEVKYKRSFVLQEKDTTMYRAIQKAALAQLTK